MKELKEELKSLKSQKKDLSSTRTKTNESTLSLNLLNKLHEAYELGLLTEEEYEKKRQNLVDRL